MPPLGAALKRETGELIWNGSRPGIVTSALAVPLPTRDAAQRLRACEGVAPSSFAAGQVGKALLLTAPCLSIRKSIAASVGGVEPSLVRTWVTLLRTIGALALAGSSRGCMSTVAVTQRGPMQAPPPEAVAPPSAASATVRTATFASRPFNQRPLQGLNTEPWRKVLSLKSTSIFACRRPSGQPALAKLSVLPLYFHSRPTDSLA